MIGIVNIVQDKIPYNIERVAVARAAPAPRSPGSQNNVLLFLFSIKSQLAKRILKTSPPWNSISPRLLTHRLLEEIPWCTRNRSLSRRCMRRSHSSKSNPRKEASFGGTERLQNLVVAMCTSARTPLRCTKVWPIHVVRIRTIENPETIR